MKRIRALTAALFLTSALTGCSCLCSDIRRDIENDPKLLGCDARHCNIQVLVEDATNGFVTLRVAKGFSPQTMQAIDQQKGVRSVLALDPTVDVLVDLDDILKKRPDIKSVTWRAYTGNEIAQTLTRDNQCSEYFCASDHVGFFTILALLGLTVFIAAGVLFYKRRPATRT